MPRVLLAHHVFSSGCQLDYRFGHLSRPVLITVWNRRTNS